MLEQAAASLESFLKTNIKQIVESTDNVNTLRREWLTMFPDYKQYDLQLDVEWQDLSGDYTSYMNNYWCGCCGSPPKPPTARSFKVFIRDWRDERYLSNKIGELKPTRNQVAAVKEDLTWDQ